jgi:drug/metabolite transporter (DMT)-like permease
MGLGWVAWVQALETIPVAAAGVVYMSYPMFTIFLAHILIGQAISGRALSAAALILSAALVLSPSALAAGHAWDLLRCLPAPIAFAFIIIVLSSMAPDLGTLERMGCGMAGAVAGLLQIVLIGDVAAAIPATGETWLLMGAVTAALPQAICTFATAIVGPSCSAAAGSIELPTMMAIGWLAFGEAVGPAEALAAALVIAAIAIAPAVSAKVRYGRASAPRPWIPVLRRPLVRRSVPARRGWVAARRSVPVGRVTRF